MEDTRTTLTNLSYEFDAPRFVDFSHEPLSDDELDEKSLEKYSRAQNEDGYFVEREDSDAPTKELANVAFSVVSEPKSSAKKGRKSKRSSRQSMLPSEFKMTEDTPIEEERTDPPLDEDATMHKLQQVLQQRRPLALPNGADVHDDSVLEDVPQPAMTNEVNGVTAQLDSSNSANVYETNVEPQTEQAAVIEESSNQSELQFVEDDAVPQVENSNATENTRPFASVEGEYTQAAREPAAVAPYEPFDEQNMSMVEEPESNSQNTQMNTHEAGVADRRSSFGTANSRMMSGNRPHQTQDSRVIGTVSYDPRIRRPSPSPSAPRRLMVAVNEDSEASDLEAGLLDFGSSKASSSKSQDSRRSSIAPVRSSLGSSALKSLIGETNALLSEQRQQQQNRPAPRFRGSWMAHVPEPAPVRQFVPSLRSTAVSHTKQDDFESQEYASSSPTKLTVDQASSSVGVAESNAMIEEADHKVEAVVPENVQPNEPHLQEIEHAMENGENGTLNLATTVVPTMSAVEMMNNSMSDMSFLAVTEPMEPQQVRRQSAVGGARPIRSILNSTAQRVDVAAIQPSSSVVNHSTLSINTRRMSDGSNNNSFMDQSSLMYGGYRVKDSVGGRGNAPGYMTPTASYKSKQREKVPLSAGRPQTPPSMLNTSRQMHTPTQTQPKAFHLATSDRRRSNSGTLKSSTTMQLLKVQEERQKMLEKKRMEQEKLMRLQRASPRAPPPKPMTEPQPFSFDRHTQKYVATVQHTTEFHSLAELSKSILRREKPAGNPTARPASPATMHSVTVPQAPVLRSDSRVRGTAYKSSEEMELERIRLEKEEERRRKEQNRAMMERSLNSIPSAPVSTKKPSLTEPEPFPLRSVALHERSQEEFRRREEDRLRREEEKRKFKARPVPSQVLERPSHLATNANHHQHELTVPVAPTCVERASIAEQMRLNRLEAELKDQERIREFHARPLPKTTYVPGFLPAPAPVPLVEPRAPALRLDQRAERWQETEQQRKEREEREAMERQELERQRREEEEALRKAERAATQFKARPVPRTSQFRSFQEDRFDGTIPEFDRRDLSQLRMPASAAKVALGGGAARIMAPVRPMDTLASSSS